MTTSKQPETTPQVGGVTGDERSDLLATLALHRGFLRYTIRGLTDDQAAQRTTVSELTLGGLVKHVAATEAQWVKFVVGGAEAMFDEEAGEDWADGFRMVEGETVQGLLGEYDAVARRTEEAVAEVADLGAAWPLPEAPWFEPGAAWSARRVLYHLIAETAQHSGHADIIRESLDGAKTMA
ncbi:DUF664 domain-containing protein [Allosaccharopolyspora coralli]|uniref:DUF664 domain-containing protein n=1 Tax=Allosaccharopolyspora coralli TaxID=2665642 RepID=A0A5Q3QF28_9PSEU|nr:DinB family protein [Allosaccharopolyspora coralli]QGK70049.1 DUF664 domain-containing protein [Allosaccharopolyspora coralli]